ncbi:MAG: hypothetical protein ACLUQ6_10190 [Alistipes onderdonkii]
MTSVNGMLVYYDKAGKEYREVFEQANGRIGDRQRRTGYVHGQRKKSTC